MLTPSHTMLGMNVGRMDCECVSRREYVPAILMESGDGIPVLDRWLQKPARKSIRKAFHRAQPYTLLVQMQNILDQKSSLSTKWVMNLTVRTS